MMAPYKYREGFQMDYGNAFDGEQSQTAIISYASFDG